MQGFRNTKIEEGEEIIFGPHTSASQTNLSVHRVGDPEAATHTSFRIVCVTNRRLIIETGDSAISIPTKDIQSVTIKRKSGNKGTHTFDLLRAKKRNGSSIQLNIPNLEGHRENELTSAFPKAAVKENKGIIGFLDKILGG